MKTRAILRLLACVVFITATHPARAIDHTAEATKHWAFQPLRAPELPGGKPDAAPIDRFVSAKLKDIGLAISPEADRMTLIRRVAFTVTGLPPGELASRSE